MQAIETYYAMVDRVLEERFGLKLSEYKLADNQWLYVKSPSISLIEVNEVMFGDKKMGYIQSFTPICKLPRKRQEFMLEILKLNHGIIGAYFALYENTVMLKMIRDIENLDEGEVENMIQSVGHIGKKIHHPLIKLHNATPVDVTLALLQKMAKINPIKI
jgi:hypothetical protein